MKWELYKNLTTEEKEELNFQKEEYNKIFWLTLFSITIQLLCSISLVVKGTYTTQNNTVFAWSILVTFLNLIVASFYLRHKTKHIIKAVKERSK